MDVQSFNLAKKRVGFEYETFSLALFTYSFHDLQMLNLLYFNKYLILVYW